jgi:hypothetical protein
MSRFMKKLLLMILVAGFCLAPVEADAKKKSVIIKPPTEKTKSVIIKMPRKTVILNTTPEAAAHIEKMLKGSGRVTIHVPASAGYPYSYYPDSYYRDKGVAYSSGRALRTRRDD